SPLIKGSFRNLAVDKFVEPFTAWRKAYGPFQQNGHKVWAVLSDTLKVHGIQKSTGYVLRFMRDRKNAVKCHCLSIELGCFGIRYS
ncbi:hypothetical protein, partial [Pseudomonas brassicae]|uniref:hypothetical protein n=1 Tax=Pseudomonas brassicae TaxID=2708063 RepID=UPI001FB4F989